MPLVLGRMTRTCPLIAKSVPVLNSLSSLTCVCAAILLLAACESSQGDRLPTAPSPPPTPAPPSGTHTLSGVVTADGRPAAGVRVAVLETQPEPSATTDENGRYSIPQLQTSWNWDRTLVRFSKTGFFTDFKRPNISADTRLDVALDPLVLIELGDVVRGTVRAGDASCAGQDYEPDPCQRFAMIAPAAGILDVTLASAVSPGLWALDLVNPEGQAMAEFHGAPKRLSITARAGGTYEIRVVGSRTGVEFELMTSLR